MQAHIAALQVFELHLLDGFDHGLRDEIDLVIDARQVLGDVEQQGSRTAEQRTAVGGDDLMIGQFEGDAGVTTLLLALTGSRHSVTEVGVDACLLHQQGDFRDFGVISKPLSIFAEGREVAAHDFVLRSLGTHFVIADAEAHHVDTHVGGRLVGRRTVDAFEEGIEHGEDLDVAVVVDRHLAVGFEVEGVNHIDITEVGGGSFVSNVDGVLEGKIPDREGLELGITSPHTVLCLVVELREADCHLSATRTRGCDDDEGTCGLEIFVATEAVGRSDDIDVARITFDEVLIMCTDAHALKTFAESLGTGLTIVVGDDHAADVEATAFELAAQTKHVLVVGDAEVGAHLVLLDVGGADDNNDLGRIGELAQHSQLAVGLETGQDARGMMVVEEFATQFEVEFALKVGNALLDMLGLDADVLVVVES